MTAGAPDIRVVRGNPDHDELAALTVALMYTLRQRSALSAPATTGRGRSAPWEHAEFAPPGAWTSGPGS